MEHDTFDVWFCGERVAKDLDFDIAMILVEGLIRKYREQLKSTNPILNRGNTVEIAYHVNEEETQDVRKENRD